MIHPILKTDLKIVGYFAGGLLALTFAAPFWAQAVSFNSCVSQAKAHRQKERTGKQWRELDHVSAVNWCNGGNRLY